MKIWHDNYTNSMGALYTKNQISFSGYTKLVYDGTICEGMNEGVSLKVKTSPGSSWSANSVIDYGWSIYSSSTKTQAFDADVTIDIKTEEPQLLFKVKMDENGVIHPTKQVYNVYADGYKGTLTISLCGKIKKEKGVLKGFLWDASLDLFSVK